MSNPQLWQLGVLIFASIASSRCLALSRSLGEVCVIDALVPAKLIECPLQGASFGGRLVFMDGEGLGSGLLPALSRRGRMIIFQAPPAHLRSHMGSGRGLIWIGSRNCQSSSSEPGLCPWTGDRPCLDTGIPCVSEPPSYNQSYPLEFSEVTKESITVTWPAWDETTDIGVGPITGYKILHRQLGGIFQEILLGSDHLSHRFDGLTGGTIYQFRVVLVREGEPPEGPNSKIQNVTTLCRELEDVNLHLETSSSTNSSEYSRFHVSWQLPSLTADCLITRQQITLHQLDNDNCSLAHTEPTEYVLETGQQTETFEELSPNSLYNITYRAINPAGTYVTSQISRTNMTQPTGAPNDLQHDSKRNRIEFSWSEPSCGERNGEIRRYEITSSKNRQEESGRRRPSTPGYKLRHLSNGDRWFFKVRACNEAGCGPYARARGVMD